MNVVTPLMVYLPFITTVAQRYDKKAGIGTVVALRPRLLRLPATPRRTPVPVDA